MKAILGVIVSANIKSGKVPDELVFEAYVGLFGKWSLIEMNMQVFLFTVQVFTQEMSTDDLVSGVIFLKKMSEDDRSWIIFPALLRRATPICGHVNRTGRDSSALIYMTVMKPPSLKRSTVRPSGSPPCC